MQKEKKVQAIQLPSAATCFPHGVFKDFPSSLVARILPCLHDLLISKNPSESNTFTGETLRCGKSRFQKLFSKLKTCQFEKAINIFAEKRSAGRESLSEIYAATRHNLSKCVVVCLRSSHFG
jgi:hypothetical protein